MRQPAPTPSDVPHLLARHLLVDGFDLVADLDRSSGSWLVDARDGRRYLDMFTFFASSPLGMNHPSVTSPEARELLGRVAASKPSNSDVPTVELARFVETFERVLGDPALPHLFLVEGGTLAVENALKVAFDWKSRRNEAAGRDPRLGTQVIHLTRAFHGRSGYCLSVTNTEPVKTARFPVFDWPRVDVPAVRFPLEEHLAEVEEREARALDQVRRAFEVHGHDVACFLAEPIQGEGGDHHLRPQFLHAVQAMCHANEALLVLDEVQTGAGLTGTPWAHTQLGLAPDVVAFGKKVQVCGVMAGRRVDEEPDNVFRVSSRINSTWGGGLVDLVRSRLLLEAVEADGLIPAAGGKGAHLLGRLHGLAAAHPSLVEQVRGRGLMCAFTLPDRALRDALLADLLARESVLMLGCGSRSVRFRPHLAVTHEELDLAVAALDRTLARLETPDVATADASSAPEPALRGT